MGTSFANIQVRSSDRKAAELALNPKGFFKSYYTGEFDGWISVLGSSFNWETVGLKAIQMSKQLSEPVGAIGYFDDDILIWEFYQNGQRIQTFTTGNLEEYELDKTDFDFPALIEMLQIPVSAEKLEEIFDDEEDLMSIVEKMEALLGIPLWMKCDWVQDDEKMRKAYRSVK